MAGSAVFGAKDYAEGIDFGKLYINLLSLWENNLFVCFEKSAAIKGIKTSKKAEAVAV